MSMGKKEIEKQLTEIQQEHQQVLEQKRLEWLQQICREAKDTYQFTGLGEFVMWMIDHAGDISLKSGGIQNEQAEDEKTEK